MKSLKYCLLFIITVTILGLSGCSTHEGPTYGESVTNEKTGINTYRLDAVAILDKSLQTWTYYDNSNIHKTKSKIAIENLGIRLLPSKNVEVFTTIRNRTDYPQQLLIRTQFYDKDKVSVENPTAWQRIMLPENSTMTYKSSSITINKIEHFLIEVKEGD